MKCSYTITTETDVGLQRQHNEDYYATLSMGSEAALVAVADGVGGLSAGDVASRLGATAYLTSFSRFLLEKFKVTFNNADEVSTDVAVSSGAKKAVDEANDVIRGAVANSGTTLVSALLLAEPCIAYIINVGDSRAYLIDDYEITQVTRDHSAVWSSFEEQYVKKWLQSSKNEIKITDFASDKLKGISSWKRDFITEQPKAHVIWNVIGYFGHIEYIDVFRLSLKPGDKLLLTTDGLTDMVDDYEIWDTLRGNAPDQASHNLVNLANARGGLDNITFAIIDSHLQPDNK
ncbi:MAG: protein phosphatase 2C domain-containing protein [Thermoprotei archaeon]